MHGLLPVVAVLFSTFLLLPVVRAAVPVHQWSRGFGTNGNDGGDAVVFDSSANLIITGRFGTTADFGGGPLTSAGNVDVFLARYDPSGAHLWSKSFGGTFVDEGHSVAVDAVGNVIVTGEFTTTIDFGGGPFTNVGGDDGFIAKFDANGVHLWSKAWQGSLNDIGWGVATDAAGNIIVAGQFSTGANLGSGPMTAVGANDILIAKLDANGIPLWIKNVGSAGSEFANACDVDAAGNVGVAGLFNQTVDFGGGPLTSAGLSDAWVASYDAAGAYQWSRRAGGTGPDAAEGVAVDGVGSAAVAGVFRGTVDFGGGPITSSGASNDIFVAKYDATGAHLWSKGFGDASASDVGHSIASNTAGDVVLGGFFGGTVNFGGSPHTSAGGLDAMLVGFSAAGVYQFSQTFGGPNLDTSMGLALRDDGALAMTGAYGATINFGGPPLTNGGSNDAYLAKFTIDFPVPVLFSRFTATPRDGVALIEWDVASDETLDRYTLYRKEASWTQYISVSTGDARTTRAFSDRLVEPGKTYDYLLSITGSIGDAFQSPTVRLQMPEMVTTLSQNYPNPYNPRTTIAFTLGRPTRVTLEVFDVSGRRVATLVDAARSAGRHTVEFDASRLSSGIYSYRLVGGGEVQTRKMAILK